MDGVATTQWPSKQRNLRIHRPLVFFDLETTGLDPCCDRIIEIALMHLALGADPRYLELRFHPERPVPPAASAIHGIHHEHLAHCPPCTTGRSTPAAATCGRRAECASNQVDAEAILRFTLLPLKQFVDLHSRRDKLRQKLLERAPGRPGTGDRHAQWSWPDCIHGKANCKYSA